MKVSELDEGRECLKQLTNIDYNKINGVIWQFLAGLNEEDFTKLRDQVTTIHFIINEFYDRHYEKH